VAAELTKAVGHRVQLHYTEHPGIPTACFAETRFLVDRVTITDNEPAANQSPAAQSGPAVPGAPASPAPVQTAPR